jgi:hypothetical protein
MISVSVYITDTMKTSKADFYRRRVRIRKEYSSLLTILMSLQGKWISHGKKVVFIDNAYNRKKTILTCR